jgi:hypothetical protein
MHGFVEAFERRDHAIYTRQTVSFKMGSPLKTVGVINADVSTGIAGWTRARSPTRCRCE